MSKTVATEYTRTYTSFSGCDIVCTFGNVVIAELQAITYHVQREKAPVYTMGSAEPRSFSRGKRGIAGTLVFTIFDRDALLDALQEHVAQQKSFHRIGGNSIYELDRKTPLSIEEWDSAMTKIATNGTAGVTSVDAEQVTRNISEAATPVYADEIPPFDSVRLTFEYDLAA